MTNIFGKYLRSIRISRNMNQTQVAQAVGKSTAYICDLEKGRRGIHGKMNPLLLIQLADFLNVPVSEVLARAGLIDKELEAKYGQYFRILRSKMRAQRVGECIKGCKDDIELLKNVTLQDVRGPGSVGGQVTTGREIVNSLELRILALEQTLTH
jgi:transcriptional regulator with XRE-family HTH domain